MNQMMILMAVMQAVKPLIELFMQNRLPKYVSHQITVKPYEKDGVTGYLVHDITEYKTEEEAKNHVMIQENLNSLAKTIQK